MEKKDNKVFKWVSVLLNVVFAVFILLSVLMFCSYLFIFSDYYISLIKNSVIICGFSTIILAIIALIVELFFYLFNHRMYVMRTTNVILIILITAIISVCIIAIEMFLARRFTISL